MKSGDKAYYIDFKGEKHEVTISGSTDYNMTAKDEFGRVLEFPAGKLQPIADERLKNDED